MLNPKLKGNKKSGSQKKKNRKTISKRSQRTSSQPPLQAITNNENQNVNQKADIDLKKEEIDVKETNFKEEMTKENDINNEEKAE